MLNIIEVFCLEKWSYDRISDVVVLDLYIKSKFVFIKNEFFQLGESLSTKRSCLSKFKRNRTPKQGLVNQNRLEIGEISS